MTAHRTAGQLRALRELRALALTALDATVAEFKRKGFTRASRSSVIRAALRGFVTREYTRDAEGPL
jgi:hypothetical protein